MGEVDLISLFPFPSFIQAMPSTRLLTLSLLLASSPLLAQSGDGWRVHDMSRPHPATAPAVPAARADQPPPGAVILFDGHGLSHWVGSDGAAPKWTATREYFEARPGVALYAIIEEAEKHRIDLIVLAASGRSRVARFFVGSTADRVIRQAPCPAGASTRSAAMVPPRAPR